MEMAPRRTEKNVSNSNNSENSSSSSSGGGDNDMANKTIGDRFTAVQHVFADKTIDQLQSDVDDNTVVISGFDSDGKKYKSIQEMWREQGIVSGLTRDEKRKAWYSKAEDWYEENCPATVDGVLGGFATISDIDLQGSKEFLFDLRKVRPSLVDWGSGAACECGAGIGRVTKGLLLDLGVTQVDVVESSPRLLCESPEYIGEEGAFKCRFYCTGLQDWTPPKRRYSLIWIQWVLCYLTDDDIIEFLKQCAEGLLGGGIGVIVLKENICGEGTSFVVDKEDASVCRSLPYWLKLIAAAGLRVILQKMQDNFPDEIFPVPMLALEAM